MGYFKGTLREQFFPLAENLQGVSWQEDWQPRLEWPIARPIFDFPPRSVYHWPQANQEVLAQLKARLVQL